MKKVYIYTIKDRYSNKLLTTDIKSREWAREEKNWYKSSGYDAVIVQEVYTKLNEQIVR